MKVLITLIFVAFIQSNYAQSDTISNILCDSVVFNDGSVKIVQIQKVKSNKVIYLLCCDICTLSREFNRSNIDTIIYNTRKKKTKEKKRNSNAIYVNIGNGLLYFTATAYYEKKVTQNTMASTFIKTGIGGYALWGEGGYYALAQYGILAGSKNNHLELAAGINYFINGDLKGQKYPFSGTLGYRFHKPDGNFIFRTGVSWPEAVYVGLGFSF